jgi:hypothetical protein
LSGQKLTARPAASRSMPASISARVSTMPLPGHAQTKANGAGRLRREGGPAGRETAAPLGRRRCVSVGRGEAEPGGIGLDTGNGNDGLVGACDDQLRRRDAGEDVVGWPDPGWRADRHGPGDTSGRWGWRFEEAHRRMVRGARVACAQYVGSRHHGPSIDRARRGDASATHRGRSATCLCWWRWGDSNSGLPPQRLPGDPCAGGLTCGALAPVVTAGDRCSPLSAIPACTHRVPALSRAGN